MSERIGRNVFSMGLSRVISGLVIFVVYIRLVTYLGPHEFGKFALVLTYYTIFLLLLDLGISKYAVKKISENKDLAASYTGNFFAAQILISLLVFFLMIIIPRVLNYDPDVALAMLLAGFGLFLGSLSNPLNSLVQAHQRIHILAAMNFINTMINAAWILFVIINGKSFVFLFWVYGIIGILNLVVYFFATRRLVALRDVISFGTLRKNLVSQMLIFGIPFAFISGFEILIAKADSVIQKIFLPYSEVGLYAGAYRFIDALTFVPAVIAISLFPYFAAERELKTDEVKSTIEHWNRYLMILAIPMGVGATILADKIVLTLFDERYIGSIASFQILIWAAVITFIYAVPNVMMIVKKTRAAVWVLSLVTIFNIAANLIFVPKFGIIASAWFTVVSYFLVGIFYINGAKNLADFALWRYAFWPLLCSIPMGVLVWYLREMNFLVVGAIGAIIYFAILRMVGFLDRGDLLFVKSIFLRK